VKNTPPDNKIVKPDKKSDFFSILIGNCVIEPHRPSGVNQRWIEARWKKRGFTATPNNPAGDGFPMQPEWRDSSRNRMKRPRAPDAAGDDPAAVNPLAFGRSRGNPPRIVPATHRKPLWLYPNLLSLDAPLVAVAWLYVFAKTWRLGYHPWEAYASLGMAVWILFTVDRLLDASMLGGNEALLEPRHTFHWRHRRWFRLVLMVVVPLLIALVVLRMPMAIYKHLLLAGVMIAGFFGLVLLSPREPGEVSHGKNILGGAAFAFGTAITAHVYRYQYDVYDMLFSREFLCFAVLCILNISATGMWERRARAPDRESTTADELSLTLPLLLLAGVALSHAVMEPELSTRPFFYAILTGAGLLYVLNRCRSRFPVDALRALADVAMLGPVLVFLASRN